MKSHKLIFIGIVSAMVLLGSCTTVFINEISRKQDFSFSDSNLKTAIVIGTEDVVLNDFIKTFYRNYSDYHKFVADYVGQFTGSLNNANILARVESDTSFRWGSEIYYSYFAKDKMTSDSVLIRYGANYLIRISGLEVSNRVQTSMIPGGSNTPPIYKTSEHCIVKARFQVFDLKTQQNVMEFITYGEGTVVLLTYQEAFNEAIKKSIAHAVEYLKSGKKEF